ncbi:MAG: LytTR family DNA-binding domain-containing protein [Oscillospiraceae bacterium]|nr:LytTR family DNA-binding domain-containing protein [Oscillospiraceae bacterium]
MIRIAICDDDDNSIQSCKEIITSMNINDLDMIDSYESGEVFLNEVLVKNVQYDIVILDIDMPGMNGFEVAKKLNEREIDMLIMFYTAHEQYVFKAFEFQPFRYIRKEFTHIELPFAIRCAIDIIENKHDKNIVIRSYGSDIRIKTNNIVYFAKNNHYTEIFLTQNKMIETRTTLSQLLDTIDCNSFIYVNKGCVVNMKHIEIMNVNEVVLDNGEKIPISRRNYKTLKAAFSRYIGGLI